MKISRGLAALILILFFQITLSAKFLYKDDVVQTPEFTKEIEEIGSDLYEQTGISLKLVMIRDIPNGMDVLEYQKQILSEFNEPTILLIFAELNSKVDISVSDRSLYKHFNRHQVLSPVASAAQAFAIALIFAESFENFKELANDNGGTILPLLGARAKGKQITGKYAAAMFNGYLDIAEQVSDSKEVILKRSTGNSSEYILLGIKIVFYGILILALLMYLKNKLFAKKEK